MGTIRIAARGAVCGVGVVQVPRIGRAGGVSGFAALTLGQGKAGFGGRVDCAGAHDQ